METNTPKMWRPKRKLCYLSSYENPPQTWTKALTLMDVDKIFDDMDSSPPNDPCPPSLLCATFDAEILPDKKGVSPIPPAETAPDKDQPHPSNTLPGPSLDAQMDIPFVAHFPAKTSSPIEEKLNLMNSPPVTPALFPLEDETQDKANAEPPLVQKHQSNEEVPKEKDITDLETPPSKIVITKRPSHKKDTQSIRKNTLQTYEPVVAQRKPPESAPSDDGSKKLPKPKKLSTNDLNTLLLKLKKTVQAKPPSSRKSALPVEVPASSSSSSPSPPRLRKNVSPVQVPAPSSPRKSVLPVEVSLRRSPRKTALPVEVPAPPLSPQKSALPIKVPAPPSPPPRKSALPVEVSLRRSPRKSALPVEVPAPPLSPQKSALPIKVPAPPSPPPRKSALPVEVPASTSYPPSPPRKSTLPIKVPAPPPPRKSALPVRVPAPPSPPQKSVLPVEVLAPPPQKSALPFEFPAPPSPPPQKSALPFEFPAPPSPPPPQKSALPVEVPPPPLELEDEFLILDDDDTKFHIYIPSKTLSRKGKQSRSNNNKDSSSEKESKESLVKTPQKQEEPKKASDTLGREDVGLGTKIGKGNKRIHKDAESESRKASSVDSPSGDVMTQENVNEKKPPKKKLSKKSAKNPQTEPEAEIENPPEKLKTNATKSSETKKSKTVQSKEEQREAKKSPAGTRKRRQVSDAGEEKTSSLSNEEQNETEAFAPPTETQSVKPDPEGKVKQSKPVSEQSSTEDEYVFGKRRRKQTGEWWMVNSQSPEETDNQVDLVKKSKISTNNSNTGVPLPTEKNKKDKILKKRKQKETLLFSPTLNQAKGKKTKQNKNRNTKKSLQDEKKKAQEVLESAEVEQEVADEMDQEEQSIPSFSTHRNHNKYSEEEEVIPSQTEAHNNRNTKVVPPVSPGHLKEQLHGAEPAKCRGMPSSNRWMENNDNIAAEVSSHLTLPHKEHKPSKGKKKPTKPRTYPERNNQDTVDQSSKPAEGTPVRMKAKTVKPSLVKVKHISTSGVGSPSVMESRDVDQHPRRDMATHPAVQETNTEMLTEGRRESASYAFRSGPASLIMLEEHEEDGEIVLPTTTGQAVLSVSDLCGPPLQPLSLHHKDKVNLGEMFKCIWSTLAKNDAEITPDHFDWFFYKDRAMGILEDLNNSTYCSGKLLLGSYMKKPLWVDHSATTVFHLNSSTVNVTVDARKFSYSPGQAFVVNCGCAYSIKNITAQPALLYFTRMLAESSD